MRAIAVFITAMIFQGASAQVENPAIVPNLHALARLSVRDSLAPGTLLPENFNWNREARRAEALKRTVTQQRYWDCQGRELPPDAYRNALDEAVYRQLNK